MKKRTEQTPADVAARNARNYAVKVLVGEANIKMRNQIDRLNWALDFAQRSAADLADEPLDMARGEILAFLGYHQILDASIAELTPTAITNLSSEVAQDVKDFLSTGWSLPTTITLWRGADGVAHTIRGDTLEKAFLATVAELLIKESKRVAHCPGPGCGRLFAKRKRGLYCSTKCAVAARTQRLNLKLEK